MRIVTIDTAFSALLNVNSALVTGMIFALASGLGSTTPVAALSGVAVPIGRAVFS